MADKKDTPLIVRPFPHSLRKRLKGIANQEDMTLKVLVVEMLKDGVEKYDAEHGGNKQ